MGETTPDRSFGVISSQSIRATWVVALLLPCLALSRQMKDTGRVPSFAYEIELNETEVIVRTHPFGRSYPLALIDMTQNAFVYIDDNDCFVGELDNQSFENVNNALSFVRDRRRRKIIKELPIISILPTKFYVEKKLSKDQVRALLHPKLWKECRFRDAWKLIRTKPRTNAIERTTKTHGRNRAPKSDWPQADQRGRRKPRSTSHYYVRQYRSRPRRRWRNRPQSQDRIPPQAEVSHLSKSYLPTNRPYTLAKFVNSGQKRPMLRHYDDFNEELRSSTSSPELFTSSIENTPSAFEGSHRAGKLSSAGRSVSDKDDFKFPDTIVKDGQVFYRHDATGERELEKPYTSTLPTNKPSDDKGAFPGSFTQGVLRVHQNTSMMTEPTPPMGFNLLMDHVRQMGAQGPIISAAIAGASISGSSKGSTSHVIGSAINGGYFAASAQGYDSRGGAIHSHVQGTAEGVSGGASAIAPNRDGEAFIQVDHSEKGLSIGQSSTHNGEAFVIADVDRQTNRKIQQGDSTSSYDVNYNSKVYGHTFGEARSKLSPSKRTQRGGTTNILEHEYPNQDQHSQDAQRPSFGMDALSEVMEEVHHPDINPMFSFMDKINDSLKLPESNNADDLNSIDVNGFPRVLNISQTHDESDKSWTQPQIKENIPKSYNFSKKSFNNIPYYNNNEPNSRNLSFLHPEVALPTNSNHGTSGVPLSHEKEHSYKFYSTDQLPTDVHQTVTKEYFPSIHTQNRYNYDQNSFTYDDKISIQNAGDTTYHNGPDYAKFPTNFPSSFDNGNTNSNFPLKEQTNFSNAADSQYDYDHYYDEPNSYTAENSKPSQTYPYLPEYPKHTSTSKQATNVDYNHNHDEPVGNQIENDLNPLVHDKDPYPPTLIPKEYDNINLHKHATTQTPMDDGFIDSKLPIFTQALHASNRNLSDIPKTTVAATTQTFLSRDSINKNNDRSDTNDITDEYLEHNKKQDLSPEFSKASRTNQNEKKIMVLSPGIIGTMQRLQPSGPGQPEINVVTMDSKNRNLIYQSESNPIFPGDEIPGLPGYRVPPGFRGRVVFGSSSVVNTVHQRPNRGPNANIEISPQITDVFSTNGHLQGNLHSSTNSGLQNYYSGRSLGSLIGSNGQRNFFNLPPRYIKQNNEHSAAAMNYRSIKSWNNRIEKPQGNNLSNELCTYYKNNCKTMNGAFQNSKICTPQLISVPCCC